MTRKMKDSGVEWIGEIPEGWEVVRIKYLADEGRLGSFQDGDWIESPYIGDSGIRYLTSGNIGDGFYKEQGESYVSEENCRALQCIYVYPGDLIFSRLNAPHGRSCILPDNYDRYVIAVDNVVLRPSANYSRDFICYLTQCDGYQKAVQDESSGSTMQRISRTKLGNIALPIPRIEQQEVIVSHLNHITYKICEMEQFINGQISTLYEYKKSLITETVTKGLNKNVPMKDSGIEWIGEIPEHWGDSRLKNIIIDSQSGVWGEEEDSEVPANNRICIRVADFDYDKMSIKDNGEFTKRKYTAAEIARYQLRKDDILIEKSGGGEKTPVGRSVIWDGRFDALYANFIQRLRVDTDRILPMFVQYCFYSFYNQGGSKFYFNQTIGIQNLNMSLFMSRFRLPIPSLDEQKEIVAYLDSAIEIVNYITEQKHCQLQTLEEYKKSIIYEYVTGKKEVPHD